MKVKILLESVVENEINKNFDEFMLMSKLFYLKKDKSRNNENRKLRDIV